MEKPNIQLADSSLAQLSNSVWRTWHCYCEVWVALLSIDSESHQSLGSSVFTCDVWMPSRSFSCHNPMQSDWCCYTTDAKLGKLGTNAFQKVLSTTTFQCGVSWTVIVSLTCQHVISEKKQTSKCLDF